MIGYEPRIKSLINKHVILPIVRICKSPVGSHRIVYEDKQHLYNLKRRRIEELKKTLPVTVRNFW